MMTNKKPGAIPQTSNAVLAAAVLATSFLTAASAHAGVMGTAYLRVSSLEIDVDIDSDGIADTVNLADYLNPVGGTRSTTSSVSFIGDSAGDEDPGAGFDADSDTDFLCLPASACGGISVSNNSAQLGALVNDETLSYSISDAFVSGSAFGNGATGMTYADASIAVGNGTASATGTIANKINIPTVFDVLQTADFRFRVTYDAYVESFISGDVLSDSTILGVANSSIDLNFSIVDVQTDVEIKDDGFGLSRIWNDPDPLNFNVGAVSRKNATFTTDFVNLSGGRQFSSEINQDSTVSIRQVPVPGTLAILGAGLLAGLGSIRRRSR